MGHSKSEDTAVHVDISTEHDRCVTLRYPLHRNQYKRVPGDIAICKETTNHQRNTKVTEKVGGRQRVVNAVTSSGSVKLIGVKCAALVHVLGDKVTLEAFNIVPGEFDQVTA